MPGQRHVARWKLTCRGRPQHHQAAQNQLCGLANYQINFTPEQLKKLYRDPKAYQANVLRRYDELMKEGWALPVYRSVIAEDAGKVSF